MPNNRSKKGRRPQGKRPQGRNRGRTKPTGAQAAGADGPREPADSTQTVKPKPPPAPDTKRAKREAARAARIEAEKKREQARRRKRYGFIAVVLAVAVIGVFVVMQRSQNASQTLAKQAKAAQCGKFLTFKELPRQPHIEASKHPRYNSVPPTSGLHFATPANWGSYDTTVEDRTLVHNLEHGGVIIHYKGISAKDADKIKNLADSYADGVVSQPNSKIKAPVVLVSWTHMQSCRKVSIKFMKSFISAHCGKAPEKVATCK